MSEPIRVAISGGGLAGATLLFALLPHSHLEVHVFESASAFKEAGAAVGVSRNAQAALSLIGQPAVECLQRAGAVPQKGVQAMMGQGAGQGSMVCLLDADNDGGSRVTSIVHRAALLRELLASVPADHMHVSKKLESVDRNNDGSLTIHLYVFALDCVGDPLLGRVCKMSLAFAQCVKTFSNTITTITALMRLHMIVISSSAPMESTALSESWYWVKGTQQLCHGTPGGGQSWL